MRRSRSRRHSACSECKRANRVPLSVSEKGPGRGQIMSDEVKEQESSSAGPLGDLYPYRRRFKSYPALPAKGRKRADLMKELKTIAEEEDAFWRTGKVSGTYYHGGKDHYAFLNRVFALFSHVNLLPRDICPSGTKFESEIISMTARMLHGEAARARNPQDEVCGSITSGGTESIILPILAYRDRARAEKGITEPEMVVPDTIHPASSKGAHYFGVKLIRVPVGEDYLANVEAMRRQITSNTIAIAGSAANYPHGLIDPIDKLSELALEVGVGLHVDSCFGGFILPWIEKLGYAVPVFH